jgi:hypothetical protein
MPSGYLPSISLLRLRARHQFTVLRITRESRTCKLSYFQRIVARLSVGAVAAAILRAK